MVDNNNRRMATAKQEGLSGQKTSESLEEMLPVGNPARRLSGADAIFATSLTDFR
jgi:hypothetical protein